jgi:hypothetical protein
VGCCDAGVPGVAAGGKTVTGPVVLGAVGAAGMFGMYNGPAWPQPASDNAAHRNAKVDFTIRITD